MSTPSAQDYRRASEAVLLDGIRERHPLALAEAYHRVVPAAHAVARRLVTEANEVEDVLQQVFGQLWEDPPEATPLEGWARRATWAACAARLRASGRAPASPSASVLLPDLPAPDVRFLDASERAIADLADEERRALLLAHDKGVPTSAQDPGADIALVRALMTLAGPESSAGDRDALDDDGCTDVVGMGDWCLGIADEAYVRSIDDAIEERTGCAARSRAVRRGRRRIEGLPATPDMGHRVLVSVLTSGGGSAAAATDASSVVVPTTGAPDGQTADDVMTADTSSGDAGLTDAGPEEVPAPAGLGDRLASDASADADPIGSTAELHRAEGPDASSHDLAADPFDALSDDEAGDVDAADLDAADVDAADIRGDDGLDEDDPFAELVALDAPEGSQGTDDESGDAVPAAADAPFGTRDDMDWAPNPGDTAELSLSDILAEDDDDDPFAALDQPVASAGPATAGSSAYAALSDLDDGGPAGQQTSPFAQAAGPLDAATPVVSGQTPVGARDDLDEVYVEGQDVALDEPVRDGGGFAAVLAWILPVLGGLAVGVLLAMQVFG